MICTGMSYSTAFAAPVAAAPGSAHGDGLQYGPRFALEMLSVWAVNRFRLLALVFFV